MQDLQKDGIKKAISGRCELLTKPIQCPARGGLRNLSALFLNTLKCVAAGRLRTSPGRADKKVPPNTLWKWLRRHRNSSGFLAYDGEAGKPYLLREIVTDFHSVLLRS